MDDEDRLLWNRAFDKFDHMEKRLTELCLTTSETKNKVDDHLAEQEAKGQRKERVFYVVIAAMASVFSIVSFVREQF